MFTISQLWKEKINPITGRLLLTNIINTTGWAFVNPIFALYVVRNINGANVKTIGIAYFIYWVVKAVLQLFISDYLDRMKGEMDDYTALLAGQFLVSLVPFLLIFTKTPFELYLVFFLYAIGDAFWVPSWNSLFTRHVNPKRVSFQWALNSTGFNLGSAVAILIGSSFALAFGFPAVFVAVTIVQIISFFTLYSLKKHFYKKAKTPVKYFFAIKS
ncbi:MFS transporter [bacterium]|nr:MFS transporter [bacterium]